MKAEHAYILPRKDGIEFVFFDEIPEQNKTYSDEHSKTVLVPWHLLPEILSRVDEVEKLYLDPSF